MSRNLFDPIQLDITETIDLVIVIMSRKKINYLHNAPSAWSRRSRVIMKKLATLPGKKYHIPNHEDILGFYTEGIKIFTFQIFYD